MANPYAPQPLLKRGKPVRIRGVVQSDGQGLIDVSVSDGRSVVRTGTDGTFEIISDSRQAFVQLTVPGGFEINKNPTGTARFYAPIKPDAAGEATASFELSP